MTDIEIKEKTSLLEICYRRGNSSVVQLLIEYGTDTPEKILFDLIDDSMNDLAMTEKLISIYRTITEHCFVLCERLKVSFDENYNYYPRRKTRQSAREHQREVMSKLLSSENDERRNVLEHAIETGADTFLQETANTLNVYKVTPEKKMWRNMTLLILSLYHGKNQSVARGDGFGHPQKFHQTKSHRIRYIGPTITILRSGGVIFTRSSQEESYGYTRTSLKSNSF